MLITAGLVESFLKIVFNCFSFSIPSIAVAINSTTFPTDPIPSTEASPPIYPSSSPTQPNISTTAASFVKLQFFKL